MTALRLSRCALVLAIAFFFTLVVFNNTTDYDSNYGFVQHVLAMDTTFAGNGGLWRAIHSTALYRVFYGSIILWEAVTGALCWWGGVRMTRARKASAEEFARACGIATAGLTLGCLLWLVAFLTVGGEWFLMWQSAAWNGQEAAFRMFVVLALTLVYITAREPG